MNHSRVATTLLAGIAGGAAPIVGTRLELTGLLRITGNEPFPVPVLHLDDGSAWSSAACRHWWRGRSRASASTLAGSSCARPRPTAGCLRCAWTIPVPSWRARTDPGARRAKRGGGREPRPAEVCRRGRHAPAGARFPRYRLLMPSSCAPRRAWTGVAVLFMLSAVARSRACVMRRRYSAAFTCCPDLLS